MYPKISYRLLPEECQEYTLFLQPGIQPFLIAATTSLKEDEEPEATEKQHFILIAVITIFQGLSQLWSWLRRRLRRRRTIDLPVTMVEQ